MYTSEQYASQQTPNDARSCHPFCLMKMTSEESDVSEVYLDNSCDASSYGAFQGSIRARAHTSGPERSRKLGYRKFQARNSFSLLTALNHLGQESMRCGGARGSAACGAAPRNPARGPWCCGRVITLFKLESAESLFGAPCSIIMLILFELAQQDGLCCQPRPQPDRSIRHTASESGQGHSPSQQVNQSKDIRR
jgi:hypothetical protein